MGKSILWFGVCASGLVGLLLVYGLLQERIMQRPYSGGDVYSDTQSVLFLVFLIRGASALFALCMLGAAGGNFRHEADLRKYFYVGFAQVAAGALGYGALKFISYTVQAMGKSFKMIPVMIWSLAISGKMYGLVDWVVATLVTGGMIEFVLTGPIASSSASGNVIYGMPLLIGAVMVDGFIVTMQEKLFAEHKTTKYNQLLYTNGMSALVALGALVLTGEMPSALRFAFSHSRFLWDAQLLSVSFAGVQYFKASLVKDFGALAFAATMNVRQMLSILASYMVYHHHITVAQACGLIAVFGALLYRSAASFAAAGSTREA